jgi:hypothetical protein
VGKRSPLAAVEQRARPAVVSRGGADKFPEVIVLQGLSQKRADVAAAPPAQAESARLHSPRARRSVSVTTPPPLAARENAT